MRNEVSSVLPVSLGGRSASAWLDADRLGVFASVLCAIHCLVTPFLLLAMPAWGQVWAHPASHWGMALVVVPIALLMISKGYQRHRRTWILVIGVIGVVMVLAGAVAPYWEATAPSAASACDMTVANAGVDLCCPSVVVSDEGASRWVVPLASILTTAGGIFLIMTHLGNLCCCPGCHRKTD